MAWPRPSQVAGLWLGLVMGSFTTAELGADSVSAPYDPPQVADRQLVAPDAISLDSKQRSQVLKVLVQLAGAFPDTPRVDMDVREKAMAVALSLDPIDVGVRTRHAQLMKGEVAPGDAVEAKPAALGGQLVFAAYHLYTNGDGYHDPRLARLLLEIGLTVHPDPPANALQLYEEARRKVGGDKIWSPVVTLTSVAGDGASYLKAKAEREARARKAMAGKSSQPAGTEGAGPAMTSAGPKVGSNAGSATPGTAAGTPGTAATGAAAPGVQAAANPGAAGSVAAAAAAAAPAGVGANPAMTTTPQPVDTRPISELQKEEGKLAFVSVAQLRKVARGGTVSIRITDYDETEEALVGFFSANNGTTPELLLRPAGDTRVRGTEQAEAWVRQTYERWPTAKVARVALEWETSASSEEGRGRPGRAGLLRGEVSVGAMGADASLPLALILESLFSGQDLDPTVAISGELASSNGGLGNGKQADLLALEAARDLGAAILVTPQSDRTELRDAALLGELDAFFQPQLIEVANLDQLRDVVAENQPEAAAEGIAAFAKVQELTGRMELADIATNAVVQEKLREILALIPGHVSARMLLSYGTRGDSEKLSGEGSLTRIDNAIQKLKEPYDSPVVNPGADEVHDMVKDVEDELRRLRPLVDSSADGYLMAALDLLQPMETYLSLSNRDTSIGLQRRREVEEKLDAMQAVRRSLAPDPGG